jgi:rubrerythrin
MIISSHGGGVSMSSTTGEKLTEKVKDYTTSTKFAPGLLMDKLSEFITVERGGAKLYQAALQSVRDPEVVDKFRHFYEETRRHEEILANVIRSLGGDPDYMSRGAKLAQAKAESPLNTMTMTDGVSPKEAELNAMENIILAEIKDYADWELLDKIAHRSSDSNVSSVLKPVVSEVQGQEDEHLNWTRQAMARLQLAALSE